MFMVWKIFRYPKYISQHSDIIFYVVVLLTNKIAYSIWGKSQILYYFFHSFAPLIFILIPLLKETFQLKWIVFIWLACSLILWYLTNYFAFLLIYCISISALMLKANSSANRKSKELKHSYLPIIIALDLFFALIGIILKVTGLNWGESHLIGYLKFIILPVSLSTLLFIFDKTRRYSSN